MGYLQKVIFRRGGEFLSRPIVTLDVAKDADGGVSSWKADEICVRRVSPVLVSSNALVLGFFVG